MKRLLWIFAAAWLLTACSNGEELFGPDDLQHQQLPNLPNLPEPDALPHVDDVLEVIDDPYFARYSLARFDSNGDNRLSMAEVECAERIIYEEDTPELQADYSLFISMKGIEYFKNLEALEIRSSVLTELDLSHNSKLQELHFEINQEQCYLKRLDVSHTRLKELEIPNSNLEELLVSGSHLKSLRLYSTNGSLKSLDVRYCEDLENLNLHNTAISEIDLRYSPRLKELNLKKSALSEIELSENQELVHLDLSENNINKINLKNNTKIEHLSLRGNNILVMDLSMLKDLEFLDLSDNPISEIDITCAEELLTLLLHQTNLTTLNTDFNTKLEVLECTGSKLESLDLTTNPNIRSLHCQNNEIADISLGPANRLQLLCCENNRLTSLDFSGLNITAWHEWRDEACLSSFAPQPDLEVLTLPACSREVSMRQLTGCPKLRKVVLYATQAPELIYEGEITPLMATLYVPSATIASYEASSWAKLFLEIRSL